ncbi:MAG: hypothetical protein LR015_09860 [Verrucomicrobia bacterium]|nr:hypothetical protein [Verrucomicrobiota bacterium]
MGVSVPVHFRSVSILVLESAGSGTLQVEDRVDDWLEVGSIGLAQVVWQALPERAPTEDAQLRYRQIVRQHPQYAVSGGPSPHFEALMRIWEPVTDSRPVLQLMLPRPRREGALSFLEQSPNVRVQGLLGVRELAGWQHFMPVFTSSGHPLDAVILTTAMLEQSGAWRTDLSRQWHSLSQAALSGDTRAQFRLEQMLKANVAIGTRARWAEMAALVQLVPDADTLIDLSLLIAARPDQFAQLAAGLLMTPDPAGLIAYLLDNGDPGWQALPYALRFGQGSLAHLTQLNQPLYEPPPALLAAGDLFINLQRFFSGFRPCCSRLGVRFQKSAFYGGGVVSCTGIFAIVPVACRGAARFTRSGLVARCHHWFHRTGGLRFGLDNSGTQTTGIQCRTARHAHSGSRFPSFAGQYFIFNRTHYV